MKLWKKILCVLVLALLLAAAALAVWQRENLNALAQAQKYTQEELEEKLAENGRAIREAMADAPEITVRDLTDAERQALRDGTLSKETLVEQLLAVDGGAGETEAPPTSGPADAPSPQEPTLPQPSSQPQAQQPQSQSSAAEEDYRKRLSALIAEVYVLREEYTISLENMESAAKADYRAIPEDKRTKTALAGLVSTYLSRGSALEKECDGKMDAIVAELETLIKENQGDMTLVDLVVNTYADEKSLKKAWYMSKLEKRGLI